MNMGRWGVIVKANKGDIPRDRQAILLGGSEYTVSHLVRCRKNSRRPLLPRKFKEPGGSGPPRRWHEITPQHQLGIRGHSSFFQALTIPLIALIGDKMLVRPVNRCRAQLGQP